VLRTSQQLTEDEVKAYVKDNLARYKTPREVVFLDQLPRNPTGKVLKRELLQDGHDSSGDSSGQAAAKSGAARGRAAEADAAVGDD